MEAVYKFHSIFTNNIKRAARKSAMHSCFGRRVNVTLQMQCIGTQLPILCFCFYQKSNLGLEGMWSPSSKIYKTYKASKPMYVIHWDRKPIIFSSCFPETSKGKGNEGQTCQGHRLRSFNFVFNSNIWNYSLQSANWVWVEGWLYLHIINK